MTAKLAAEVPSLAAELYEQAEDLRKAAHSNYSTAELYETLSLVLDSLDALRLEYGSKLRKEN